MPLIPSDSGRFRWIWALETRLCPNEPAWSSQIARFFACDGILSIGCPSRPASRPRAFPHSSFAMLGGVSPAIVPFTYIPSNRQYPRRTCSASSASRSVTTTPVTWSPPSLSRAPPRDVRSRTDHERCRARPLCRWSDARGADGRARVFGRSARGVRRAARGADARAPPVEVFCPVCWQRKFGSCG